MVGYSVVGKSVERTDGRVKVTGRAEELLAERKQITFRSG